MSSIVETRLPLSYRYNLEDIDYIKAHYQTMTAKAIGKHLKRKQKSVEEKIKSMDLKKISKFWENVKINQLIDRVQQTDFPLRVIAAEFHISETTLNKILRKRGIPRRPKQKLQQGWKNGCAGVSYKGAHAGKARVQLLFAYKNTCWDCKKTLLPAGLVIHHDWSKMPVEIVVLCRECHKKRHGVVSKQRVTVKL